jgi:hypothetical protein
MRRFAMNEPRLLADILKDYFQNSNEHLAVEFRKYFAGTDNPLVGANLRVCLSDSETPLEDWINSQDVMQTLHISPRTLQTLNREMFLRIVEERYFYRSTQIISKPEKQSFNTVESPFFSFFKAPVSNTKPHKAVSLLQI